MRTKSLPVGQVLRWGGNVGFPAQDYAIIFSEGESFGQQYRCFPLDHPEDAHNLQQVPASQIWDEKSAGPAPHRQYFFLTNRVLSPERVEELRASHIEKARLAQAEKEKKARMREAAIERGREMIRRIMPEGTKAVIVAMYQEDISDPQTDYFDHRNHDPVILAWSKHERDLFSEMRKAAGKSDIPEVRQLGPGMSEFDVWSLAAEPGGWRRYDRRIFDDGKPSFATREEAENAGKKAVADGSAPFGFVVIEKSIEHREKYAGGGGYYLKRGVGGSGWIVKKERFWRGSISDNLLEAAGQGRISKHLIKKGGRK